LSWRVRYGRSAARHRPADATRLRTPVYVGDTPAFFVNGRALFGAHPFATFQKVIEEELSKN